MNTNAQKHPAGTTFLVAGGFSYIAQVRTLARPKGHFNLRITSRWDGARDPDAEQVALNLTLSRDELAAFIHTLQAALETPAE